MFLVINIFGAIKIFLVKESKPKGNFPIGKCSFELKFGFNSFYRVRAILNIDYIIPNNISKRNFKTLPNPCSPNLQINKWLRHLLVDAFLQQINVLFALGDAKCSLNW